MKGLFGLGKKKDGDKAENKTEYLGGAETSASVSSSKKWLIQYDRRVCIGSGTCAAVCEKHWRMKDDGKAELIGAVFNNETQMFEKAVPDSEFEGNRMAAEGCPPICIHITNTETGEKII
jgi:ferredoxin